MCRPWTKKRSKFGKVFHLGVRDFLDQAEKMAVISSADRWFGVRELRNKAAHDYEDEALSVFFKAILGETDFVISEIERAIQ